MAGKDNLFGKFKSNAIGYKLKNGRIKVKTSDFYELEQVLKNHEITIKEIQVKAPKWFELFYKEYKSDIAGLKTDITHIKNRLDNIESDVSILKSNQKLMMNTPTMKKELKQT